MENTKTLGETAGGRACEGGSKWEGEKTRQGTMLQGKAEVAEQSAWEQLRSPENADTRLGALGGKFQMAGLEGLDG